MRGVMNITSEHTVSQAEWNTLHSRYQYWIVSTGKEVLPGLVKRCIDYATKRLERFPVDLKAMTNVHVTRNENGFMTVAFRAEFGALKVHGILVNHGGWPTLDHGISIDENDPAPKEQ